MITNDNNMNNSYNDSNNSANNNKTIHNNTTNSNNNNSNNKICRPWSTVLERLERYNASPLPISYRPLRSHLAKTIENMIV